MRITTLLILLAPLLMAATTLPSPPQTALPTAFQRAQHPFTPTPTATPAPTPVAKVTAVPMKSHP